MVDQSVSRPSVPADGAEHATPVPPAPDQQPAAEEAPRAEGTPGVEETTRAEEPAASAAPTYAWETEYEDEGGSSLAWIAGVVGVALFVLGVTGWLVARSRRRPTRRARAAEALRRPLAAAADAAGTIDGVGALRDRVEQSVPSRRELGRAAQRGLGRASRRARVARSLLRR